MSLDNAIARLRKIHDNPNPHPDDVRLDVEGTIYELLTAKDRAEAAEAEVLRLRQGLWDCFRQAGGDTDGDETPVSLMSDIVPLAVDCVRDLRQCYDQVQDEVTAAEADARRYRHLADNCADEYGEANRRNHDIVLVWCAPVSKTWRTDLNAAIDAELAKEGK